MGEYRIGDENEILAACTSGHLLEDIHRKFWQGQSTHCALCSNDIIHNVQRKGCKECHFYVCQDCACLPARLSIFQNPARSSDVVQQILVDPDRSSGDSQILFRCPSGHHLERLVGQAVQGGGQVCHTCGQ